MNIITISTTVEINQNSEKNNNFDAVYSCFAGTTKKICKKVFSPDSLISTVRFAGGVTLGLASGAILVTGKLEKQENSFNSTQQGNVFNSTQQIDDKFCTDNPEYIRIVVPLLTAVVSYISHPLLRLLCPKDTPDTE